MTVGEWWDEKAGGRGVFVYVAVAVAILVVMRNNYLFGVEVLKLRRLSPKIQSPDFRLARSRRAASVYT